MSSKLKVYELAKELGVDGQALVDAIQRLGIDIKNSMSVLGTEEVRTVREHYRKQRPAGRSTAPATTAPAKSVTEKRVGATVIRRRAKTPEPELPIIEKIQREVVEEVEDEPAVEETVALSEETGVEVETETTETAGAPEADAAPETTASPEKAAEAAPVAKEAEKKKRLYPSILKRVGTEQYLGEKVGPKSAPKPAPKKDDAKSGVAKKPGTAEAGTEAKLGGPKRVKEIEFVAPEVAKESKRRVIERQTGQFKSTDYLKRELVHSLKKRKTVVNRPAMKTIITTAAAHKRVVEMGEQITVGEFAKEMGIKAKQVITKLMGMGVAAGINERIDHDTAALLAPEFGYEIKQKIFKEHEFVPAVDLSAEKTKPRPPVVTIMGHVDHGKTSLLDAIRKTKVAAGEAGGITQHVGAYTVKLEKGKIAFIDTPGHEAFTAMRARGAKVTDIVILVVSAVDGVMPQTLESVNHAKAANVPIIVAVNKIDLPDGQPDRVKQTLAGHGLNPEEWGGDTIYVGVSAKTGQGLDKLLESILLQAEILELKANYDAPARGAVVESSLDKHRGPVATLLVQQGTLRSGDMVVCGNALGKIRAMTNSLGEKVKEAFPGDPVELLGLSEVPNVGDEAMVVSDERTARSLIGARLDQTRSRAQESKPKMTLEELMAANGAGEKELRLILKSDVQGSTEALKEALTKFPTDKVRMKVLHSGTGGISESDVMLATASKAVIMGFNIRPDTKAAKLAENEGVQLKTYTIIYDLLEDVKKLLEGLLDTQTKEKIIGRAEVRSVFTIPKIGAIAGSAVVDGKVQRGCFLRLLRDSRVVYEGKISSLKRFKEDVREVASGFECGIGLENFNDVKMGDQFEAYIKEEVKVTL